MKKGRFLIETKICSKCHQELPLSEFPYRDKAKGTYRADCKKCHSSYMKNKYQEKRKAVEEIKTSLCCQKCGDKRGYVLDFHHLDPKTKDDTVARLLAGTYSLDTVLKEIEKCVVLCANCHREFHHLEKEKENFTFEDYLKY
jgi:hypothetical protein